MSNKEDIELRCQDCKNYFLFTVGEQHFFEEKGFQQPKRCKICRKHKTEDHKNAQFNRRTTQEGF